MGDCHGRGTQAARVLLFAASTAPAADPPASPLQPCDDLPAANAGLSPP